MDVGKSISAFANTNNGIILVGVSDRGEIRGCSPEDEQKIANVAHTCKPSIYPRIEKVDVGGRLVFVVEVEGSGSGVDYAYKNVVYKRVGTHDKPLSPKEVIEFAKDIGEIRFDSQICKEAVLDDIDWTFVENFFIPEYERIAETKLAGSTEELLEALECIRDGKPTNAGILLFGKNPQRFFRNSHIALARYRGKEVGTERLDYKEFDGNLFRQIDNCDKYIKEHTAVMSRLHPMRVRREDIPEYPLSMLSVIEI
ncbi:MAG: putative DNA binding domain-containing protein, partial [Candidatus Altiarchaeales archaeon]|nr:putative DNA binding domain-containing protein [Candidatus Altiarchaeales archaeon]